MKQSKKDKFLKITKSISDKGILLIIIPILLVLNKDYFGKDQFLAIYCLLMVIFSSSVFCQAIVTGETIHAGFTYKKSDKPIWYYLLLTIYVVISGCFFLGLIATLRELLK